LAESEARYAKRRREENRIAWAAYHRQQATRLRGVLEALIGYHIVEAQRYTADTNGHHHEEDVKAND
jgi:hypothetical protein